MPGRYHFPGQRENEQVLRIIHRHWFNLFSHLFIVILFSAILVGSFLFVPTLFPDMLRGDNWRFFIFVQNTFFIFAWLYGFLIWIDYYFDVWIITNERVVNIEQKGLFVRHISELHFQRIQDVTSEVEGLLPTILDFGDVIVQTAGEETRFVFRQVADPSSVKDLVMRIAKERDADALHHLAATIGSGKVA